MELTGSALTALFVGLVWTLINVVKYFITKYSKTPVVDAELVNDQAKALNEVHQIISEIKEDGALTKEQNEIVREALVEIKRLYEMHTVYNDDHVPAWYVPKGLIELVRDIHGRLNVLCKDMEENLDDIKHGQNSIVGNMSELVNSQKLMTERLGDLILALNKLSR